MPAEIEVRRVVPTDWPALRQLRLEALADAPVAFCERLADAVAAPDALWQQRAVRGAEGGDSFQVIGWVGDRPVATSVGFGKDTDAVLAAVYVTPDCRGRGLLARLVEQVRRGPRSRVLGRCGCSCTRATTGPQRRTPGSVSFPRGTASPTRST